MLLAALHYNENANRDVIMETMKDGTETPKLRVEFVKYMRGRGKAKPVRRVPTKGWCREEFFYANVIYSFILTFYDYDILTE